MWKISSFKVLNSSNCNFFNKPQIKISNFQNAASCIFDQAPLFNFVYSPFKLKKLSKDLFLSRLDMPPYESFEKMSDKLTQAVEETCGFAVE